MHLYKVLNQPSVVRKSLPININGEEHLLAVRGTDLLQLYKLITVTQEIVKDSEDQTSPEDVGDTTIDPTGDTFITAEVGVVTSTEETLTRLVLVDQWHLDGYITDLHALKIQGFSNDCLAIAFKHAKLVLLSWEESSLLWSPISIHFYEKELFNAHFYNENFDAYFTIDPQTTCLCYVYQADRVAILPFYNEDILDDMIVEKEGDDDLPSVFQPSFLITAKQLDESIQHIIKLAFLPEYREPTLAVIFQSTPTWTGMLPKYRDTVQYLVLSLDVSNKSSVVITSVGKLPHDINQLHSLPLPIGGCILLGGNHIFHVDAAGNACGVAVNKYASLVSDINVQDQSDLGINLEGSTFSTINAVSGEMLLVLQDGSFYHVGLKLEGRKVFGMKLTALSSKEVYTCRPTTISPLGNRCLFIGSSADDAKLLKWKHKGEVEQDDEGNLNKKVAVLSETKKSEENDDYDELDDIYGEEEDDSSKKKTKKGKSTQQRPEDLEFILNDYLPNYGPINSMCLSWSNADRTSTKLNYGDPSNNCYDIVAATGVQNTGCLTIFNRSIRPIIESDWLAEGYDQLWTVAPQNQAVGDTNVLGADISAYDSYLVASGTNSTALFKIGDKMEDITMESDFVADSRTLAAGTLLEGSVVVQVHSLGIVYYDSELNKVKEIELDDEVVSAKLCSPRVVLTFADGSYRIYMASHNAKNGLPVLEKQRAITDTPSKVRFASLFMSPVLSKGQKKVGKRKRGSDKTAEQSEPPANNQLLVLVSDDDVLHIINLDHSKSRVKFENLSLFPSIVHAVGSGNSEDTKAANGGNSEATVPQDQIPHLSQLLISTIGDEYFKEDYLVIMSDVFDFVMYRIIVDDSIRLVKIHNQPATMLVKEALSSENSPLPQLISYSDIGGYSGFVVTGPYPLMVVKSASSAPQVHRLTSHAIKGFSPFHTNSIYKGMVYISSENIVRFASLDANLDYGNSLPSCKIPLGGTIMGMCYHESTNTFIVAIAEDQVYRAVDEDDNPISGVNEELPPAYSYRGKIKLISPITWGVIDEVEMAENELVMCLDSLVLTVENSKEKREVVVFGTSFVRGEDLAAKGNYYVYDVIGVVPEPGKPETKHKLKEIVKENVKAAATAVTVVEGYLLVAQGQKIVVRSLAEDDSIIPVAFIDVNTYVVDAKAARNMVLLADTLASVWLVGFGEEPYRMTLLSKDYANLEVLSAEFCISDGKLYCAVADSSKRLHLLQYDPEDPSSLQGQKLVRKSEFFTGKSSRCMILVPRRDDNSDLMPLIGSDDGSISFVSSLSETDYRTLFAIQQQVTEKDMHNACLNPRAHRATLQENRGTTAGGQVVTRPIIDYDVVGRFSTLSTGKRYVYSRRLGKNGMKEVCKCTSSIETMMNYI